MVSQFPACNTSLPQAPLRLTHSSYTRNLAKPTLLSCLNLTLILFKIPRKLCCREQTRYFGSLMTLLGFSAPLKDPTGLLSPVLETDLPLRLR